MSGFQVGLIQYHRSNAPKDSMIFMFRDIISVHEFMTETHTDILVPVFPREFFCGRIGRFS